MWGEKNLLMQGKRFRFFLTWYESRKSYVYIMLAFVAKSDHVLDLYHSYSPIHIWVNTVEY